MDFKGKTILITGGAGDIGMAVAGRFARAGAVILLTDVQKKKLQGAAETLAGATGAQVETFTADVSDPGSVKKMVSSIEKKGFNIDMLFNNAGYQGEFKPTHLYDPEDFQKVLNINLAGAFNMLRYVSEHMVANHFGAIVNTASMAGVEGPPNMIAYGASKFGVVGITQSASKDLAPYGIRVNSISPAFMGPGFMWDRQVELQAKAGTQYFSEDPDEVAAQMIGSVPMRRYGSIEEIPGTVMYLMSEDASYVTGVNIYISGGIR